jgi:RNA polymerase sigma-70 factor (ECF subfamily)
LDSLEAAVSKLRATYPALAPDEFVAFVRSKGVAIGELQLDSLVLVHACAHGEPTALATLERDYLSQLDGALVRAGAAGDRLAEVKQRLRERLLVARDGKPARIAEYGGRGELVRWLRAVAVNLTVDLQRADRPEAELDLDELVLGADDPELAHIKQRYAAELADAMRAAVARLEPEARTDLRLYYLDGLRLEDLAKLRGVALSTMSRHLQAARTAILDETRREVRARLGIGREELDSLLRLVGSRLELSWRGLDRDR